MKIALCQLNYTIGDLEGNSAKIRQAYEQAVARGADIAVFSELSLCGYPPQDLLDYPHFIERCERAIQQLAEMTGPAALLLGCPTRSGLDRGKKLYNSALALADGKVQAVFHKTLLPTYNVFDEYRYFEPNDRFPVWEFRGKKIAVTVCEDLWDIDEPHLYKLSPMQECRAQNPELIINISGSPFSYEHVVERRELMRRNAKRYGLPLVYVNQVGANTDMIFDGGSMFIGPDGTVAEELAFFEEDLRVVDWSPESRFSPHSAEYQNQDIALIHRALELGIRDYFRKSGFSKAVLGLSGGIDSAVVTVLAADVLGPENVLPVMMPSDYSSAHSVSDSVLLCQNLGIEPVKISIAQAVQTYESLLKPVFGDAPPNVAEENIQARCRAILVMAISNKFGHILLNTTNKSEAAVGYGTLYGDMCGGISVLGDVYKTQVYALAERMNNGGERIPNAILTKAPSAELRPDQKDSDSLPDYALLDRVLRLYIEDLQGPEAIVAKGFDPALVQRIVRLVDLNEYKRFQVPPILRVSEKAFGIGRQMPVVGRIHPR